MKKSLLIAAALGLTAACAQSPSLATDKTACAYADTSRETLTRWRDAGFETETADQTAVELAGCLGDTDPFLRDKIGYEGLTATLRAGDVSETTRRALIENLTAGLQADDPHGVRAPFSALGLAELARTDRIETFLTAEERDDLVATAAIYLATVSDYRAFSDTEGWRHGVAHGADFAMQLALNPETSRDALISLRSAIATQVVPSHGHAYTHGEPERLARPILFIAARGELSEEDWQTWFEILADPAPLASWGDAFSSERALIDLHNLKAFVQSIYINASLSQNPNLEPLATGALDLLRTLP